MLATSVAGRRFDVPHDFQVCPGLLQKEQDGKPSRPFGGPFKEVFAHI